MKKNSKFIFGLLSAAAFAGGAYYVVKNILNKNSDDDFDNFEEDFDVFDLNEEKADDKADAREYVTLNMTEAASQTKEENTQKASDDTDADTDAKEAENETNEEETTEASEESEIKENISEENEADEAKEI